MFAAFAYRHWNLWITMLAGGFSGLLYRMVSFLTDLQAFSLLGLYALSYTVATTISGVLIAGLGSWYLYRAIAKTGALDRFASGRAIRRKAK